MALRPSELLLAMQDRVPFYSPGLVPPASALRLLSTAERDVVRAAQAKRNTYLEQELTIYLRRTPENAVGVAGAGVGAFALDAAGGLQYDGITGAVSEFDLSAPLIAPVVVSSVAGVVLGVVGAPFTANEWDTQLAVIVAGPGTGPLGKAIISTTGVSSLTLAAAIPGVIAGKSIVGIFAPNAVVSTDRAVVGTSMAVQKSAYLTKVDATGTAYLDLADPLVANFEVGITLPPMGLPLRLLCWRTGDIRPDPVTRVESALRGTNIRGPVWTDEGGRLYLLGDPPRWDDFLNLTLVYQPIPPELTSLAQVMLVPEPARDVVAATFAAAIATRILRINPGADPSGDLLGGLQSDASDKTGSFLAQLSGQGKARRRSTIERY